MTGNLRVVNQNIPTDIIDFIDLKVKAVKYRGGFARLQGLADEMSKQFNRYEALKNFPQKKHHYFFIVVGGERVGMVEIQDNPSQLDGRIVSAVSFLFIDEVHRSFKLFEQVIYEIQDMYSARLEMDLWYGQTELEYCNKLGFRHINSRMTLT